jgi:hypothetical protein
MHGKKILEVGVRWGIGHGMKTKILKDSWIPDLSPSLVRTRVPIPDDQTVDTLILAGSHTWDADLIRSIFYEDTAAKILRVPIIRLGGEDFVSWPYTHFGVYTQYGLLTTWLERTSSGLIAIRMEMVLPQ